MDWSILWKDFVHRWISVEPKLPPTPAEDILSKVTALLFPPYKTEIINGSKVITDYSIDSNLDAALMDLQEGKNDEVSQKTINSAIKSLIKVRRILEVSNKMDLSEAEYIRVESLDDELKIEDIK
jgi:hypothetical protein